MKKIAFLAGLLVLFAASAAAAAVPTTLSFAGRLTTSSGPVDGSVIVVFRLYDVASGGTQVWTETHTLTADNGLVFAELGAMTTLDETTFNGGKKYLEIQVGTETLTPRLVINSVPYSMRTQAAETLGGTITAADVVTDVSSGSGVNAMRTGNSVTIALSTTGCATDEVWKYTAGGWSCEPDANTTYSGGAGITVASGTISLSTTGCADGSVWKYTGGAWSCLADANTTYASGAGINVGAGTISLSTTGCVDGDVWKYTASGWSCEPDSTSGGTVTQISTGTGLLGGPITTTGTLSVDFGTGAGKVTQGNDTRLPPAPSAAGRLVYDTGTAWAAAAAGTSQYFLQSSGAGAPTWSNAFGIPVSPSTNNTLDLGTSTSAWRTVNAGTSVSFGTGATRTSLAYATPTANRSITLPNASGTVAVSASFPLTLSPNGDLGLAAWDQVPRAIAVSTLDTAVDSANTSVTIGDDGLPVVAYQKGGSLSVVKCGNPTCSSGNTVTAVEAGGQYPSIAIGADTFPVISHHDATSGQLRVYKCSNAACSSGSGRAVEAGGIYSSLAIGLDGFPVISHLTSAFGFLNVVKCSTASCSSTMSFGLDGMASMGTAIVMTPDGRPVIAYGRMGGYMAIVKCATATCDPMFMNSYTTLDSTNAVNGAFSMGLNGNYNPTIGYPTMIGFKVIRCSNFNCSGAFPETTPITGGTHPGVTAGHTIVISHLGSSAQPSVTACINDYCGMGSTITTTLESVMGASYTSITVPAAGGPFITYLQGGNLKAAKCPNDYCVPNLARR